MKLCPQERQNEKFGSLSFPHPGQITFFPDVEAAAVWEDAPPVESKEKLNGGNSNDEEEEPKPGSNEPNGLAKMSALVEGISAVFGAGS